MPTANSLPLSMIDLVSLPFVIVSLSYTVPVQVPIPSDAVVRTHVPKDVPKKRYSKQKPVTSDVNPVLVALSAQAASDASGSGESKLTKRKSDFNSVYTANKTRKMEIARERLDFDRDMATAEREFNEKKLALEEKKLILKS